MSTGEAGVVIRDIEPADHDALVALWVAAWTLTLPQIRFETREPFIRERLAEWSRPPRRARLAVREGGPAGFYLIDSATRDLEQICVAPALWGTGIAEALLSDARLLSPSAMALDVNRHNPRAIAFYQREGFRAVSESISPYSGLPLIRMEWLAKR